MRRIDRSNAPTKILYCIVFDEGAASGGTATIPVGSHGLDYAVAKSLHKIWLTLHLPRTLMDYVALGSRQLLHWDDHDTSQAVLLVPSTELGKIPGEFLANFIRAGIFCLTKATNDIKEAAKTLGFRRFYNRNHNRQNAINEIWADCEKLAEQRGLPTTTLDYPEYIAQRVNAPLVLAHEFLERRLGTNRAPFRNKSRKKLFETAISFRAMMMAFDELERTGSNEPWAQLVVRKFLGLVKLPVALGLIGAPTNNIAGHKSKLRNSPNMPGSLGTSLLGDPNDELLGLQVMVTHRALAKQGVGWVAKPLGAEVFRVIDKIEKYLLAKAEAMSQPKAGVVWRYLGELTQLFFNNQAHFSRMEVNAIHRSKELCAFSDFPIGWVTFPGCTSPLAFQTPITYRPITPMTRALTSELMGISHRVFTDKLKVLVIECISETDRIGGQSRRMLHFITAMLKTRGISVQFKEANSGKSVTENLQSSDADILILSAHGFYNQRQNLAGVMVGTERWMGFEGPWPPLVILSACNTGPRGTGAVTIADQIIGGGAKAVVSAHAPIGVFHNANLIVRFLTNLLETLIGDEDFRSVAGVWYRTVSTNAIFDIVYSHIKVQQWFHTEGPDGKKPQQIFMLEKSAGRLSCRDAYKDSLALLVEIAETYGRGEWVKNCISSVGIFPESLFYSMLGMPETLYLESRKARERHR